MMKRYAKKRSCAERSQASAEGHEGNKKRLATEEFVKEGVEDVTSAEETMDLQAGNSHQLLDKYPLESVPDKDLPAGEPEKIIQALKKIAGSQDSEEEPEGNASEVDALDSGAKDATNAIDNERPSDEQPLRVWLEGMNSTAIMNKGAFNGMVLELPNEASVEQNNIAMPTMSSLVVVNSDSVEYSLGLPFAKHSPIWSGIESLEALQKTPQRPHFSPLRPHFSPLAKCSEDSRKGLAIGHMIIFANLVKRTSKLQLSDSHSMIDRSMATLVELENHGFNVEVIRVV